MNIMINKKIIIATILTIILISIVTPVFAATSKISTSSIFSSFLKIFTEGAKTTFKFGSNMLDILLNLKTTGEKEEQKEIQDKDTKESFINPIDKKYMKGITNGYSVSRGHRGIDLSANEGVDIKAVYTGKVIKVEKKTDSYGNHIIIKHNYKGKTIYTLYAHCSSLNVKNGDEVKQGDIIAAVGHTGNVKGITGNHLHFEVRVGSNSESAAVNPLNYVNY